MMTRTLGRAVPDAATGQYPVDWDREADVVVIGAGATGLPAAIAACEAGCSVILVEAEEGIVGHWPMPATGWPADPAVQKTRFSGNGMMRSLEIAARGCGVEIRLSTA